MHKAWKPFFQEQQKQDYFKELLSFLAKEREDYLIYPPEEQIFAAFNVAPGDIKCVIIGQDPYHQPNQAEGLAFSVSRGTKIPPSLRNIFKELQQSIHDFKANSGSLNPWLGQGVLLLNRVLTVRHSEANSHAGKGWEIFTHAVIEFLNAYEPVYMLWGKPAQSLIPHISSPHILEAVHPSPLSAYRGFIGCWHFTKCNDILKSQGKAEINWSV